jgi:hypothetical protein
MSSCWDAAIHRPRCVRSSPIGFLPSTMRRSAADLKRVLRPRAAGTKVILRIKREGSELDIPVTLAIPDDLGPIEAAVGSTA